MEQNRLTSFRILQQGLLLLALLCLFPAKIQAEPDMQVYNQWLDRYLDDPELAIVGAREEFIKQQSTQNPRVWLQLLLFLTRTDPNGPWNNSQNESLSLEGSRLATSLDYREFGIIFELDRQEKKVRKAQDYSLVKKMYLEFMDRALQQNTLLAYSWIAGTLAYMEYEQGDTAGALKISREALEVILKIRSAEDADVLMIKNTIAVILDSIGNKTQTFEVYEDLEKFLRQRHFRYSLAIVLSNHGLLLVHSHGDMKKAEALYRECLLIADDLRNEYLQTLSHKGIADTLMNQNEKEKALQHLNQAIAASNNFSSSDPLRSALFIAKGRVLMENQQWQEALDTVERSENSVAAQDKNSLRTIRYVMARSYAGLLNYRKAYEAQKEAFDALEALHNETKEQETSKLHIQLGLELQEQKSVALKNENELQRKAALMIIGLAIGIILLMTFALNKAREVKRSRERMQHILNNIEEGILTIGQGMQVESSLSPYLNKLLNLSGTENQDVFKHLLAVIDKDEDEKATLRSIMETCLGEDRATWDFNVGQLPNELSLDHGRRWLQLHWQALEDDNGQVRSILMAVRDITETRRLQKERDAAEQNRANSERHLQELLLIDPREARSFAREYRNTLDFLDVHLLKGTRKLECRRALHTCKGLARTLGFKELSLLVHDIEDSLESPRLPLLLDELKTIFHEYAVWVERLYPEGTAVRQALSNNLHDQVGRLIPNIHGILQKASFTLQSVQIEDRVLSWDLLMLEKIGTMLMHGLTNSVDHGFILPRQRGEKPREEPRFWVEAETRGAQIYVRLRDNGAGLNMQRLKQICEERGFQPTRDQDWTEVLFLDGVSTAEKVSTTSGRGVGLAAIQQLCSEHAGQVRIRPNEKGPGTCLELTLPIKSQPAIHLQAI